MSNHNLKIHTSRGLPGSGKTTLLSTLALMDQGRLVGRDHIRTLLGVKGVGTPAQEMEVTKLQDTLIVNALKAGQNVYVDDMNLKNAYVSRLMGFAERFGAELVVHDLTNVSVDECIKRNARRIKQVPTSLIEDLHYRFVRGKPYPLPMPEAPKDLGGLAPKPYSGTPGKPRAILIDLDGTVAIHGTPDNPEAIRKHHDYAKVSLDRPNYPVISAVRAMIQAGYYPVFFSGRPDWCLVDTALWINRHVYSGEYQLTMRKSGDGRPDYIVKAELFDSEVRDFYDVRLAFDDRNQVVDMYRSMGLTVLQVAPGDF